MSGDIDPALDLASVRRVAAELAELDVLWLEEPLPQYDVAGVRTVRAQTGIRVAGGEMVRTMPELLHLLECDALDVYQPDVVLSVGMLRARTIAELAFVKHRWFTPHTWSNGLGVLANLHVVAGVGGGPYVEFPYDPPGWTPQRRDFFLARPIEVDSEGYLTYRGQRHVKVFDLTDPAFNPHVAPSKATHTVEFRGVKCNGVEVRFPNGPARLALDTVNEAIQALRTFGPKADGLRATARYFASREK